MKIDDRCPVCSKVGEDGAHLFFKCALVKQVSNQLHLDSEREALACLLQARDAVKFTL